MNTPDYGHFKYWAEEETKVKIELVTMYQTLWGIKAARWMAEQLRFPMPPAHLIENDEDEPAPLSPSAKRRHRRRVLAAKRRLVEKLYAHADPDVARYVADRIGVRH